MNQDGIRVRSYIPGSATDLARFGAQIDHGMSRQCYGLRRCISCVAPEALRCVPVRPDTSRFSPGYRRQSPGVTTAGHGSRTAKHRCFTVAYEYQWIFRETYNRNVFSKVKNSIYILKQNEQQCEWERRLTSYKQGTLPSYPHLSLIYKEIIWHYKSMG